MGQFRSRSIIQFSNYIKNIYIYIYNCYEICSGNMYFFIVYLSNYNYILVITNTRLRRSFLTTCMHNCTLQKKLTPK